MLTALSAAPAAEAVPVTIAWQIPVGGADRYVLEVAKDPGFAQIELRIEVRGMGHTWDTPSEGVYHWRLTRSLGFLPPESSAPGPVEGSTFVSGSFAAVKAGGERVRPARLTWAAEPGADSYKLYVLDDGVTPRTMVSTTASFTVPASERNLMIEVVPYSGTRRLFRFYHYNPTLVLDGGRPEPVVVAPPPPAAVVEVAPPPPPPAEPEVVTVVPEGPARPRKHLVHVYGLAGREELTLQKLDVDLRSRSAVQGGGGGVWMQPALGLVVAAEGSYHEHQRDVAQESVFPGKTFKVDAARYTAEVALGWDLLHGLDWGGHRLPLSFVGAAAQVPQLPLVLATGDGAEPTFQKRQLSMLGASLGYGWFGEAFGVLGEAGYTYADDDDAKMAFERLRVDFYPSESFAILIGAYSRRTEMARCAPGAATCLSEGRVKTDAVEIGGFLGIGAVFR